jgi:hypothetical protein
MESRFISDFATNHPKTTLINATEGGIGFKGIQNLSLKECKRHGAFKNYNLQSRIHTEISQANLSYIEDKEVMHLYQEMQASLKRSLQYFEKLLEEISEIVERFFSFRDIGDEEFELFREELSCEPAFRYILAPLMNDHIKTTQRRMHQIERRGLGQLERLKVIVGQITYLQRAAQYNLEIIEECLSVF